MEKLKLIWTILFVVAFSTVSRAGDNVMSAVNATAAPGQNAVITILLDNTNEVNGLQFDIVLPEGIQLPMDENGKPLIAPTERTEGFTVICKKLEPGRYRMMSLSFQGSRVKDNQGAVLSVTVNCDAALKKDAYIVRFEEVHVSFADKEVPRSDSNLPSFEAQVIMK